MGTVAAGLLAAGAGERFAGDSAKLRAVVRGRAVVSWSARHALAAALDETIVVTGAVALDDLLPPGVTVLRNPDWADGLATSLQRLIAHADARGHDAVVVGLADQPFVPGDAWRAVADADETPIAVATYDGMRGNPVRLARVVWPLLPTAGDAGARVVIAERPELVTLVPCDGDPGDVDTVEDLTRWT